MDWKRHACGWLGTALVAVFAACSTGADDRASVSQHALSAPRLVDLNTTLGVDYASDPGSFTRFRDAGFAFFATRADVGRELFVSDGTPAGTRLVANLNPTGNSPLTTPALARVGDLLAFGASDGTRDDLWLSDGTAAGTRPLTRDGGWRGLPAELADGLYFVSSASGSTTAGLFRLAVGDSTPTHLASLPGCSAVRRQASGLSRFAFICEGGLPSVRTVWISDGTATGTLAAATLSGAAQALVMRVDEVWFGDGADVRRIAAGSTTPTTVATLTSPVLELVFLGDVPHVRTSTSFVRLDGATTTDLAALCGSASVVTSPVPGELLLLPCNTSPELHRVRADGGLEPLVGQLTATGPLLRLETRVAFRNNNGDLFLTDGTDAGLQRRRFSLAIGPLVEALELSGSLFFTAADVTVPVANRELWSAPLSDLDAGAPWLNLNPARSSSSPRAPVPWRGGVALLATTPAVGEEVHVVDDAGARLIDVGFPNSGLVPFGDALYGTAFPSGTEAVFRTRGQPGDVERFTAVGVGDLAATTTRVLGFVQTASGNTWSLRDFSALDAGAPVLVDVVTNYVFGPCCLGVEGSEAAFPVRSPDAGFELWRTDGTPAGTRVIARFFNGVSTFGMLTQPSGPFVFFTNFAGRLMATEADGGVREVLQAGYLSETRQGYVVVGSVNTARTIYRLENGALSELVRGLSASVQPRTLTEWQGRLVFTYGPRAWVSGPDAGWSPIGDGVTWKATQASSANGAFSSVVVAGGSLFFAGATPATGTELWRLRTPEDTPELVVDLRPGPDGSEPDDLVFDGRRLLFAADDGSATGRELWAIDLDASELDAGVPPVGGGGGTGTGGGSATGGGGATGGGSATGDGGSASDAGTADAGQGRLLQPGCLTDADCGAPGVTCDRSFPGGFCTRTCQRDTDCAVGAMQGLCTPVGSGRQCLRACTRGDGPACDAVGSACVQLDETDPFTGVCYRSCFGPGTTPPAGGPSSCVTGYACDPYSLACVEEPVPVTTGAPNGSPCTADADCASRFCIPEVEGGLATGYIGGLCVSFGARRPNAGTEPLARSNCPQGSVAYGGLGVGDSVACAKGCTAPSPTDYRGDCREGYACFGESPDGVTREGLCDVIVCDMPPFVGLPNRGCPTGFTCSSLGRCARN